MGRIAIPKKPDLRCGLDTGVRKLHHPRRGAVNIGGKVGARWIDDDVIPSRKSVDAAAVVGIQLDGISARLLKNIDNGRGVLLCNMYFR